jgi:hypothetical protein
MGEQTTKWPRFIKGRLSVGQFGGVHGLTDGLLRARDLIGFWGWRGVGLRWSWPDCLGLSGSQWGSSVSEEYSMRTVDAVERVLTRVGVVGLTWIDWV